LGTPADDQANPVTDAIRSRRNTKKLRPEPAPTKRQIEALLDAATWAPNHHMTEPWRFVVIAGEERWRLGDALAEALASTFADTPPERMDMERAKALEAPIIITIIASPKVGPKILPQEEMIAAGAALQNMLLAAHSLGLSTMVRTGVHGFSERMRTFFEMKDGESLVGMVYVGYPSEGPQQGRRTSFAEKTTWRGI
jgi:nitroreductase